MELTLVNRFILNLRLQNPSYLNNFAYGNWVHHESGNMVWKFHEAYRENQGLNFPKFFGWNSYLPTKKFWEVAQIYHREERAFYGLNKEFGTNGDVTQIAFATFLYKSKENNTSFQQYLKKFFNLKAKTPSKTI